MFLKRLVAHRWAIALFLMVLVVLSSLAFRPLAEGIGFSPEQVVLLIAGIVLGLIDVPLVDWLKHKFGLSQAPALIFAYLVSFVVAFVALLIGGGLQMIDFTWPNFFTLAATILAMAQFVYKAFNPKPQTA